LCTVIRYSQVANLDSPLKEPIDACTRMNTSCNASSASEGSCNMSRANR